MRVGKMIAIVLVLVAGATVGFGFGLGTAKHGTAKPGMIRPAASGPAPVHVPGTGRPVMIYTAYCYLPGSAVNITVVGLDGWDPQTGALQFHREFDLPGSVDINGHAIHPDGTQTPANTDLAYLCAPYHSVDAPVDAGIYGQPWVPWRELRNLFNDDFSQIAVVVADSGDSGTSVGYVDSAGKLTVLPRAGEAGGSAVEDDAVFAPGGQGIWFNYPGGVGSRDMADGHVLANHAPPESDAHLPFVIAGTPATPLQTTGDAVTQPTSGQVAVAYQDHVLAGPGAAVPAYAATGQGLKVVPSCRVVLYGWVGDHDLLCSVRDDGPSSEIGVVDTATGAVVRKLLPEHSTTWALNVPQAVSPDGSEFANAAITSQGVKLEVDSTTSNATARVLSFTADPTSQTPSMTAVIAWQ